MILSTDVSQPKQHVLVVDDEQFNRDFAQKLLERVGFRVTSVASGAEAIATAEQTPDICLALIDHAMPIMMGTEVIRQFRARYPAMVLVMATVLDDPQTIDDAFANGVNLFLIKPNGFIELYNQLKLTTNLQAMLEQRVIIDAYGPRRYRGVARTTPYKDRPPVNKATFANANRSLTRK